MRLLAAGLLLLAPLCAAFYLPGLAPVSFCDDDKESEGCKVRALTGGPGAVLPAARGHRTGLRAASRVLLIAACRHGGPSQETSFPPGSNAAPAPSPGAPGGGRGAAFPAPASFFGRCRGSFHRSFLPSLLQALRRLWRGPAPRSGPVRSV